MLYSKALLWLLHDRQWLYQSGVHQWNMSSVYQSAHVLIREDTHKLTTHTYGIHNDITKHNQPDATVINVNWI